MAKNKYNWSNRSTSFNNPSTPEGYRAPAPAESSDDGMWAKSEPPPGFGSPSADVDLPNYGIEQEPRRPSQIPPPAAPLPDAVTPATEEASEIAAKESAVEAPAKTNLGTMAAEPKIASLAEDVTVPANQTTTIGPTIVIRGKLTSNENLIVRGRIEAEIKSSKDVKLEASGIINADMRVKSVTVSGIVVGDIHAQERVWFAPEARVVGDVYTPRLVVEDGASFRGRVEMDGLEHLAGVKPTMTKAAETATASTAGVTADSVDVMVDATPTTASSDDTDEAERY